MKLCKDCKYYNEQIKNIGFGVFIAEKTVILCVHPELADPVHGYAKTCEENRHSSNCLDGKFWEAK
jgi:regulator of extracellular matrix RemA (YlzA/DUF370 family)